MANTAFELKIEVDNTDDILRKVAEAAEVALKQCGEVIEGYAKEDCPVDTGLLRNSISYGLSGKPMNTQHYSDNAGEQHGEYGNAPNTVADAVYVGSNVEYAAPVEFRSMSHQVGKAHFLRDAGMDHFDELKDKAEKIFAALS